MSLEHIIRYGQKAGAEVAVLKDGELHCYYKRADAASKFCAYTLVDHQKGRPMRWESTGEYSYLRIIEFNRQRGHNLEVVHIPEKGKHDDQ